MLSEMKLLQQDTMPKLMQIFTENGVRKQYFKNDYIIGENIIIEKCYYLERGLCAYQNSTLDGHNRIFGLLAPGATFGEVPNALHGYTFIAVTCLEKVTVLEMPYAKLVSMLDKEDWQKYTRFLLQKLTRSFILAMFISTFSVTQRLLYFFKLYAMEVPELDCGFHVMKIRLSHERIAEIIGAGRNTVTALLNRLKEKGLIRVFNRTISFSHSIIDDIFIEKNKKI
jgi:CRP/FNR family transcriptional regulator